MNRSTQKFLLFRKHILLVLGVPQCKVRLFNNDTLMKRYDMIQFGISDHPIRDKNMNFENVLYKSQDQDFLNLP